MWKQMFLDFIYNGRFDHLQRLNFLYYSVALSIQRWTANLLIVCRSRGIFSFPSKCALLLLHYHCHHHFLFLCYSVCRNLWYHRWDLLNFLPLFLNNFTDCEALFAFQLWVPRKSGMCTVKVGRKAITVHRYSIMGSEKYSTWYSHLRKRAFSFSLRPLIRFHHRMWAVPILRLCLLHVPSSLS